MFSIQKFLMLSVLVLLAWYGLRRFGPAAERSGRGSVPGARGGARPGETARLTVESLVRCPICGVYGPGHGRQACGRGDCPVR